MHTMHIVRMTKDLLNPILLRLLSAGMLDKMADDAMRGVIPIPLTKLRQNKALSPSQV